MKIKVALIIGQLVLFPICIVIAPGPVSEWCFALATMIFTLRIYLFEMPLWRDEAKRQ